MKIENLGKELDTQAMKSVVGGDNGNSATNVVGQLMNVSAPVSVLSGGPSNTSVHVTGTQNATTSNLQFSGDSYLALFPFAI